jgi:hypothetical protein
VRDLCQEVWSGDEQMTLVTGGVAALKALMARAYGARAAGARGVPRQARVHAIAWWPAVGLCVYVHPRVLPPRHTTHHSSSGTLSQLRLHCVVAGQQRLLAGQPARPRLRRGATEARASPQL